MLNVLIWYCWVQVFAVAGWLVGARLFRALPDQGYGLSKALGLLLAGFFYWILVTLRLAQNNSGAVLMALAVVLAIGFVLRRAKTDSENPVTFSLLPSMVITELLFAGAFAACALYRAYNPDITSAGGEKYMESLMLNAIVRSSSFPPNDAWLSGYAISYYYFGYVILAMVTQISGVAPSIAFNLGGATIFALAVCGAFCLGYNLWQIKKQSDITESPRRATNNTSSLVAGLLTATMLCIMGNMGGLMGMLRCADALPQSTWAWLDVREIATKPYDCVGIRPAGFFYSWAWDWSRVIKDYAPDGGVVEIITETPAFSFVLGDNHPHTLALPFVLLAIGLAIAQLFNRGLQKSDFRSQTSLTPYTLLITLLTSIVLGGLSFLNTWDFPIYTALVVGSLVLNAYCKKTSIARSVINSFVIIALSYALYLPFYATFSSQARGIGVNLFSATKFQQYALFFAPFLVALVGFVIQQLASTPQSSPRQLLKQSAKFFFAAIFLCLLMAVVFGVLSSQGRALLAELNQTGTALGVPRAVLIQKLTDRLKDPLTALFLCALIALCVTLIQHHLVPLAQPSPHVVVLCLVFMGAGLTLVPEFIFLRDLFGTRMNTVFKFYYQAWTLWAIAGGFALMSLLTAQKQTQRLVGLLSLALVFAGVLYPVFAAQSKTDNFAAQPSLDGAAYLANGNPDDAKAIAWLNTYVKNDPVILERPDRGSYAYEGRISAFTGLPTPLGWGGHQNQWRGNYDEPGKREPLINTLYTSTDTNEAQTLLAQLNITYVVVGNSERGAYAQDGLDKFNSMCSTAFTAGSTTVYKCR